MGTEAAVTADRNPSSEVSKPPEGAPPPVMTAVLGQLRKTSRGLELPELGRRRIAAMVEMAAAHPDESFGAEALVQVVRVVLALESRKAPAAVALRQVLTDSSAALHRLDRRRRGAVAREKLAQALGEPSGPQLSSEPVTTGQPLRNLDQFRPLDPDAARARAAAKRS